MKKILLALALLLPARSRAETLGTFMRSFASSIHCAASATGSYLTGTNGGLTVLTFTSGSGVWTPSGNCTYQLVFCGGGGGSAGGYGAGGGGGGQVTQGPVLSAVANHGYAVIVGVGGVGGANVTQDGTNGGDSTWDIYIAKGGGGGGFDNGASADSGKTGGCGGGGGYNDGAAGASVTSGGGPGMTVYGQAGGVGTINCGGSGGGATVAGNSTCDGNGHSAGGAGYTSTITGSPYIYASGGQGSLLTGGAVNGVNYCDGGGGAGANVQGGNGHAGTIIIAYQN